MLLPVKTFEYIAGLIEEVLIHNLYLKRVNNDFR